MSWGRVVAACCALLTVLGVAGVALGMGRESDTPTRRAAVRPVPAGPNRPAFAPMSRAAGPAGLPDAATASTSSTTTTTRAPAPTTSPHPAPTSSQRVRHVAAPTPDAAGRATPTGSIETTAAPSPAATSDATHAAATTEGQSLPLGYRTGRATRVITVTAASRSSTTARLQAWTKASGGWQKSGRAVLAHVGADGLSANASEYRSATPMGSFTLTHAFGRYANPGTSLHYFRSRPSDWWISELGPLYNTHQRCSSSCGFTLGSPNEHLYYETPYYNYAVVIDYNTANSPTGVVQGAGSAFFLHVTDGYATAGCVAIRQWKLIRLMRWLTPTSHPRILIGVS